MLRFFTCPLCEMLVLLHVATVLITVHFEDDL